MARERRKHRNDLLSILEKLSGNQLFICELLGRFVEADISTEQTTSTRTMNTPAIRKSLPPLAVLTKPVRKEIHMRIHPKYRSVARFIAAGVVSLSAMAAQSATTISSCTGTYQAIAIAGFGAETNVTGNFAPTADCSVNESHTAHATSAYAEVTERVTMQTSTRVLDGGLVIQAIGRDAGMALGEGLASSGGGTRFIYQIHADEGTYYSVSTSAGIRANSFYDPIWAPSATYAGFLLLPPGPIVEVAALNTTLTSRDAGVIEGPILDFDVGGQGGVGAFIAPYPFEGQVLSEVESF